MWLKVDGVITSASFRASVLREQESRDLYQFDDAGGARSEYEI